MSFGARAVIRLGALQHNLQQIRERANGGRILAVIKANAYGHGLLATAHALHEADAFAVARLAEAQQLRAAGIDKPVLLLSGVFSTDDLQAAMQAGFELVVHCEQQIRLLEEAGEGAVTVWMKVDTGMNRLGFTVDEALQNRARLRALSVVSELRLMTHFAAAEAADTSATEQQLSRFAAVARGGGGAVSVANSAAIFAPPAALGELSNDQWLRPGLALYGISPFADRVGRDLGLQPVLRFEARLIAVKALRKGERVGYQGSYLAPADTCLGIIAAGYGDGYSRHFRSGTPVLLNGRRVPLIGNVSMDMIAVDLGAKATDTVGDIAVLWGDELPLEEVAPYAGAIPYDIACGVTHRESCVFSRD